MGITMKVLKDREEWLQHRMNGIGGSEIAAVIGQNPFLSNQELYKIKRGLIEPKDLSDVDIVKYGTEAEKHLRELFRLDYPQYTVDYVDNNSWINDRFPWAQASLDGWLTDENGRRGVWECKTSNMVNSSSWDKWKDGIPQNYYCQVLFYMAVIEADFAILKAQLKSEKNGEISLTTRHYHIERADVEEDIKYLMAEGEKFWQMVQEGKEPGLILPGI